MSNNLETFKNNIYINNKIWIKKAYESRTTILTKTLYFDPDSGANICSDKIYLTAFKSCVVNSFSHACHERQNIFLPNQGMLD